MPMRCDRCFAIIPKGDYCRIGPAGIMCVPCYAGVPMGGNRLKTLTAFDQREMAVLLKIVHEGFKGDVGWVRDLLTNHDITSEDDRNVFMRKLGMRCEGGS